MKKIGQNIVIFLILLGITYLQPIFFSSSQTIKDEGPAVSYVPKKPKEIATKGMARYIGQSVQQFEHHYGKLKKITTHRDETWYQQNKPQATLQLSVRQGKINSILLVGDQGEDQPFQLGMTLNELSLQIDLATNFLLDDGTDKYYIEIPEEKLLLSPCVAFKNKSYALLQFDTHGRLHGIYYCDAKKLLQNMPYKITNTRPEMKQGVSNEVLTLGVWQQLTHQRLSQNKALNQQASNELKEFFIQHKKETKWGNAFHYTVLQPLYYPRKDFQSSFTLDGLLLATSKDYQLELLQQFYDLNQQPILQLSQPTTIGFAHQGSVTLLLKEDEQQ